MQESIRLRQVDMAYQIHMQAWANRAAQATKFEGSGKSQREVYVYKKFEDFFDYEKAINGNSGDKSQARSKVAKLIATANKNEGGNHG